MPDIKFLSDKDFHKAAQSHETNGLGVRKGFLCDTIKVLDEEKRQIKFVISTESVDRMGDTISVKGWELENFKKNPVVLFSHMHFMPPVGRAIEIAKRPKKRTLEAVAEFLPRDIDPFADSIFQMYLNGFMRATSVGFMPIEWEIVNEDGDDKERPRNSIDFKKQELFEFSTVTVPANPDALMGARSKGIDTMPFKQFAERTLDEYEVLKQRGFILPRKQLEQLRKHADPKQSKHVYKIPSVVHEELLKENLKRLQQTQNNNNEESDMDKDTLSYTDLNKSAIRFNYLFIEDEKEIETKKDELKNKYMQLEKETEKIPLWDVDGWDKYMEALEAKDLELVSDSLAKILGDKDDSGDLYMTEEIKSVINDFITEVGEKLGIDPDFALFVQDIEEDDGGELSTPCKEFTEEELEMNESKGDLSESDEKDTDSGTGADKKDLSENSDETLDQKDKDIDDSSESDEKDVDDFCDVEETLELLLDVVDSFVDMLDKKEIQLDELVKNRRNKRVMRNILDSMTDLLTDLNSAFEEKTVDAEESKTVEDEADSCEILEFELESLDKDMDSKENESVDREFEIDNDILKEVIQEEIGTLVRNELTKAISSIRGKVD